LYNLQRYDEALAIAEKYSPILPNEPNFPLIAGYVHKRNQELDKAVADYTEAMRRDPKMVEPYVNRGYVYNDLKQPTEAVADFNVALKLSPDNGIAHLGLAFSDLQLRRAKEAVQQVDIAQRLLGESGATHLVRATAYREQIWCCTWRWPTCCTTCGATSNPLTS
jgi:tetratricopeptide (TPR) repeat protein